MFKTLLMTLWKAVRPHSFYSWQSALGLSVLAWLLCLITRRPETMDVPLSTYSILSNFGWIFLIIATGWFTTENPVLLLGFSLGPWLTGILVCLFLFVRGEGTEIPRVALISWPLISTAIAAFPEFVQLDEGVRLPRMPAVRQWLILVVVANLLLTCWIFFGFRIQDWLNDYPGLRGEEFRGSPMVVRVQPRRQDFSRGADMINQMELLVRENSEGRTMTEIERWLFEIQRNPNTFRDTVMNRLAERNNNRRLDEALWELAVGIGEPEYKLTLQARWQGPRQKQDGYTLQQVCQVGLGSNNRGKADCDRGMQVLRR